MARKGQMPRLETCSRVTRAAQGAGFVAVAVVAAMAWAPAAGAWDGGIACRMGSSTIPDCERVVRQVDRPKPGLAATTSRVVVQCPSSRPFARARSGSDIGQGWDSYEPYGNHRFSVELLAEGDGADRPGRAQFTIGWGRAGGGVWVSLGCSTQAPPRVTCTSGPIDVPGAPTVIQLTCPVDRSAPIARAPYRGVLGPVSSSGAVTYTPQPGYVGPDDFEVATLDSAGKRRPQRVAVEVGPPPVGSTGGGTGMATLVSPELARCMQHLTLVAVCDGPHQPLSSPVPLQPATTADERAER